MTVRIRAIKKMVEDNGIKILVHGPAGAGKTVLSATSGESTLIISAEAGLLSIKDAPDYIKGAEIETMDDLEEMYQYLFETSDEPDFKWVALDSITEIAERILSNEKKHSADPRKAYMEMQDRVMVILRKFRDLKGYNIVMTCKQQYIPIEGASALFAPMMPGQKLHQQIPYIFDEVFALRVVKDKEGNDVRVLQTCRDSMYEAKDRSGCLADFEKPSLKHIAKKIKGIVEEVIKEPKGEPDKKEEDAKLEEDVDMPQKDNSTQDEELEIIED